MPIFDNHIHLQASFKGIEAAKAFENAGGTAFLLTHMPYAEIPIRVGKDYERAYRKTLAMADAARQATSIRVFVALGPYPVDFLQLKESVGPEAAADAMREGFDLAAGHIAEQRAVAFGEIGRPHFPVGADVLRACNELLAYGMARARESDCAVVLHTEDPSPQTFAELAEMAAKVGLDASRVVKHHSTPLTRPEENYGLVPSVLAKQDIVTEALKGGPRFLLETDYIDDPRRPGAVLGPATVPRKTKAWIQAGVLTEADAWSIHHDLPERTYRIDLD